MYAWLLKFIKGEFQQLSKSVYMPWGVLLNSVCETKFCTKPFEAPEGA